MAADVAVGIDLGTTFSVVAYVDKSGHAQTIANSEGDLSTPSAVYFHPDGTVVGREAVKAAAFDPDLTAQFAKRDIGKSFFGQPINGIHLPPEVLEAIILGKLRDDAAVRLGDFKKAVITVPAFFNEPRRQSTINAGKIAGIEVLDIINEPTAAAIAYGVRKGFLTNSGKAKQKETILVYDLGGGTFDVTVMEIDGRKYTAVATAGDVHLGGIDWDRKLADHLAECFLEEHGIDPRHDRVGLQTLRREAEEAKRALSTRPDVMIAYGFEGHTLHYKLDREKFEELTSALLQRTIFTVKKVLRESLCQWSDITRILLVGGSTRMPMVQEALFEESGIVIDRSLSPDEAVGHGAALYAGFLLRQHESKRPQFEIKNVNSHDLGVLGFETKTGMRRKKVLIPRNTPLPVSGKGTFVTRRKGQPSVLVTVIEGGDASGKHGTLIGKCVVSDLPAKLPARSKVVVKFNYSANGQLMVTAGVLGTECQAKTHIEREAGLTPEGIELWTKRIAEGSVLGHADSPREREQPESEDSVVEVQDSPTMQRTPSIDASFEADEIDLGGDDEVFDEEGAKGIVDDVNSGSYDKTIIGKFEDISDEDDGGEDDGEDKGLEDFLRGLD